MSGWNSMDSVFNEYTKKHSTYRGIEYKYADRGIRCQLHPVLVMSQFVIDSLIEEKEVIERNNPKYKQWRKTVLSRDSECIVCSSDENLNVHHLFSYKEYPELRINEGNGVTLCDRCHTNFHKQYGKTGGTPVDLINFMKCPVNPHKSKEEKLNLVTDIIKEVYDKWGSAPRISVYGIIKERLGVNDGKIDELINILKNKGIIFEPKPDYYKVI